MLKLGILVWLSWLLGNPFIAIIVLLVILYFLDRRFVGLSPSISKPFKRRAKIRKLKFHIQASPNDVSSKHELARLLIDSKKFRDALEVLQPLERTLNDSAEYWDDLGHSLWHSGQTEQGEAAIRRALELNPRVKYGAPYLRLASIYAKDNSEKAIEQLRAFQDIHSSSCEAYYRLWAIYRGMGMMNEAKRAAEEGLRVYRSLPKYKKRTERGFAVRLLLKK